jgi:Na+/H+-dicarboxylate symporter
VTVPNASTSDTSSGVRAIVALAAGFAVGVAWRLWSGDSSGLALNVADPVGTIWVNAIRMTVVPLVVSLIVTGIAQSRDTKSVGRLGVRAMVTFVALLGVVSLITALLAPWVFSFLESDPAASATLRQSVSAVAQPVAVPGVVAWLTGLVPVNPVKAAADAAMLPLLVFTVSFALACRYLPLRERSAITGLFQATGDAMLIVVRWVLWVAPIGIFALALALGIRLGAGAAGTVAFYLVVHSALLLLAIAVLYLAALVVGRVPLARFARAAAPAQVVAMSTRSSMAALPAMLEAAEQALGISRERVGFLVPFAVSVFRMNQAVSWVVGGLFVAALYGVPFDAREIATLAVACVAMSFSVPGIPSGSLFMIAPFFVMVGLPAEGVGVLIALDTIPDVFKTSLNVTGHLTATAIAARE